VKLQNVTEKRDISASRLLLTHRTLFIYLFIYLKTLEYIIIIENYTIRYLIVGIVVSVTESKPGYTNYKINGRYYWHLLTQELLLAIHSTDGDVFVFQQDSAPARRARDTFELLRRGTPQYINLDMWPANSPKSGILPHLWRDVSRIPIRDTDERQ